MFWQLRKKGALVMKKSETHFSQEKRRELLIFLTYGLKSKNWKLSVRLLILFVVLHCVSLLLVILLTATGNVMDTLRACFSQLF